MNIEKLEKLNELKEKGVLSDEEFKAQKEAIIKEDLNGEDNKKTGYLGVLIVGVVLILCVIAGDLLVVPKCDSKSIIEEDLIEVLNDIPLIEIAGAKVVYVENAKEIKYNESQKKRICQASAKLNTSANIGVNYTIQKKSNKNYIEASLDL